MTPDSPITWELLATIVSVGATGIGILFAAMKYFHRQFSATLDRAIAAIHADIERAYLLAQQAKAKADSNEREILLLRAELPNDYVKREDYAKNIAIFSHRFDVLTEKLTAMAGQLQRLFERLRKDGDQYDGPQN